MRTTIGLTLMGGALLLGCEAPLEGSGALDARVADVAQDMAEQDSGVLDAGVRDMAATDSFADGSDAYVDAGPDTPGACPPGPVDDTLHARIVEAWETARPAFEASLDAEGLRDRSTAIYNVQLSTANLLMYADYTQDATLVESLATLYARAYHALRDTSRAQYYFAEGPDGVERRQQVFDLEVPTRMWAGPATAEFDIGPEHVLDASQFLYAVARIVRIVTEMEAPSAALRAFVAESVRILADHHYLRWVQREAGGPATFQVRGWGCNPGTFDHGEHLANLQARRYGTAALGGDSDLSYCNAVTDVDLWIIAGIAELMAAANNDDADLGIDGSTMILLSNHVHAGLALIESRHGTTSLTDRDGMTVTGAVFDRGAFDDHQDQAFSGFAETGTDCDQCRSSCTESCPEFPGWKDNAARVPRVAPTSTTGTGWDLSHARRLVSVYDSLRRHRALFGSEFPTAAHEAQFARQLTYAMWNGNLETPRFATYFDGTNGWYRVNYSSRNAFGYAPGAFTATAVTCGFGFWRSYEAPLGDALDAVVAIYESTRDPSVTGDARQLILVLPELAAYEGRDEYCPWSG